MNTRRDIIKNEYLILSTKITNILNKRDIMPSLDIYELSDIIYMLVQHFSDCDDTNYKSKIDFIIDLDTSQMVNQDDRNKIYDVTYDFVKWFKKLQ